MRSDQKNRGENTLYRGKGKKGNLDCTAFHLTALEDGHFGRLLFAKRLVDLSLNRPADRSSTIHNLVAQRISGRKHSFRADSEGVVRPS